MSKQTPKSKSLKARMAEAVKKTEQARQAKMEQAAGQAKMVPSGPEGEEAVPEKKSIIKEKTPEEKAKAHKEGIIKTIVAACLGILAGIISFSQYGAGEDRIWYALLMIVIALTYYVQKLIYPSLQISTKEFKFKDWFFVEFIVVDFCLVTWTLLLN